MRPCHSPKPRIFGTGYGKHIAEHLKLVILFLILALKTLITALIPEVYYENVHWAIIDMYYRLRGKRYGTIDPKRCEHCGSDLTPLIHPDIPAPNEPSPEATSEKEPSLPRLET